MTKYYLRSFKDIYMAVADMLKVDTNDATTLNRIKRDINMVYMNDILPDHNWQWAKASVDIIHRAFFSTGTVSVTSGSKSITFSSAPSESKEGHKFFTTSYDEIYTIETHAAGATSATLNTEFTGATNATAGFKVAQDSIRLPVDFSETDIVWNDHMRQPMEPYRDRRFLSIAMTSQRREGRPVSFRVTDYLDPAEFVAMVGFPASTLRESDGLIRKITYGSDLQEHFTIGDGFKIADAGDGNYNGKYKLEDLELVYENTDIVFDYDDSGASYTDITAAANSTGTDVTLFAGDKDEVIFGHSKKFYALDFVFDTVASGAGVNYTFEYSDGSGSWVVFSPTDGTDGARKDGAITWELGDTSGWGTDTVNAVSGKFWIKLERKQSVLTTPPIEDIIQAGAYQRIVYMGKENFAENSTADTTITTTRENGREAYESQRALQVYPYLNDEDTTIHVKYIKQVSPMENDDDEPIMPMEDRKVIVDKAASLSWDRVRNPEASGQSEMRARDKLGKMNADVQDSTDLPSLQVDRTYLRNHRTRRGRRSFREF